MVEYFYHTALGKAVLNIEGKPLKHLGKFKTEAQARQACDAHFAKACKAANNFGHARPRAYFM